MHEDDPPRLKQAPDSPPSLVRALEALRKGPNETARLERVAGKLGALLDAPPHVATLAGGARPKLSALKLILGGLALLAPAVWLMRSELWAKPEAGALPSPVDEAKRPQPAAVEAVAPLRAKPGLGEADTTGQSPKALAPTTPAAHDLGRPAQDAQAGARVRPQPRAARSSASSAAQLANPTPVASQVAPEVASQVASGPRPLEQRASASSAEPRKPSAVQPSAADETVAVTKPVVPSESKLLFDARKAMPGDPALALERLDEHEKLYPKGLLVPEREVLAIEALRSLGRKAEAEARMTRFKARYPDSFHLQRLQR